MNKKEIFENYNNIAVFGMSTDPAKPAHTVPLYFIQKGYNVVPINPRADEIAGKKAYGSIDEVPGEIDILNVFRPSDECLEIVEKAVKRHREKGDIKLIWLQEGIVNNEAEKIALENGIDFIQNECLFKEYVSI